MDAASAWPNDRTLALSLVVNVEEGAEYNIADGDKGPEAVDELGIGIRKPIRNYSNESNYAYGIKSGAPRILSLFRERSVKATFTAAAVALEQVGATSTLDGGSHDRRRNHDARALEHQRQQHHR